MTTHFTAHVHTPSILLDAILAFGTFFGVGDNPEIVLRLGGALELPLLQQLTGEGCVTVVSATEAELGRAVGAGAGDGDGGVRVLG